MFPFLLLPKFAPPRPAHLYLVKASALMCLLLLSLLLAPHPAHAQGPGGGWSAAPCDAQGNPLTNPPPQNSDGYVLTGPQNGTLSNTYPPSMILAALAYPDLYGDYLYAGNPIGLDTLGVSPDTVSFPGTPDNPNDRIGAYTPGFANALNYGEEDEGSYSIDAAHGGPSSGPIIGSVTGDMSGQLVCYFKMSWSGPSPAPDHADFLLSTYLYAKAEVDYPSSVTTGLSVTATASDDAFNETASASAGDGASSNGVPEVDGYHLVQASVDPQTMIAEVYLNGTAQWSVSNMVPYLVPNPDRGGYTTEPAAAVGGSFVRASAKQDSREIRLSRKGAHNETVDPDGTVHGDTTYSYNLLTEDSTQNIVQNVQTFHPNFIGAWSPNPTYISTGTGPLFNISWQWNPTGNTSTPDTWQSSSQCMPEGSAYIYGSQWYGPVDSVQVTNISYTATDLGTTPNATGAGNYVLSIHDQFDNWRLVDPQGNPTTQGSPGALQQLASSPSMQVPCGQVPVSMPDSNASWVLAGIDGGGAVTAAGAVVTAIGGKTPTWVGVALTLAGVAMVTAGSQPTTPTYETSPDPMNLACMQSAYQSGISPAGQIDTLDPNLSNYISSNNISTPQQWQTLFGLCTVVVTVSQKTLNYNFYANEYDTGGLVTTTYPGSVTGAPNGLQWSYVWSFNGAPVAPHPIQAPPTLQSANIMPSA